MVVEIWQNFRKSSKIKISGICRPFCKSGHICHFLSVRLYMYCTTHDKPARLIQPHCRIKWDSNPQPSTFRASVLPAGLPKQLWFKIHVHTYSTSLNRHPSICFLLALTCVYLQPAAKYKPHLLYNLKISRYRRIDRVVKKYLQTSKYQAMGNEWGGLWGDAIHMLWSLFCHTYALKFILQLVDYIMVTWDFVPGSPSHQAKERLGTIPQGTKPCLCWTSKQEALRLLSTLSWPFMSFTWQQCSLTPLFIPLLDKSCW